MCVIIVKAKGVDLPSYETLKRCYYCNPHGMGFATATKRYKTLDFEEFYEHLSKVEKKEACIIHFRYATHGSIKPTNCHPFKYKDLYFAHNGILSVRPKGDMTDSETAFRSIIAPAYDKYGYESEMFKRIVFDTAEGSKFALLRGNDIKMYGSFIRKGNLYFSNLRHEYSLLGV